MYSSPASTPRMITALSLRSDGLIKRRILHGLPDSTWAQMGFGEYATSGWSLFFVTERRATDYEDPDPIRSVKAAHSRVGAPASIIASAPCRSACAGSPPGRCSTTAP